MHFIACFEEWQIVILGGISHCSICSPLKMYCFKYGTCQLAQGHAVVFCEWLHKTMAQLIVRICENRRRNAEKMQPKT